MKHRIIFLLLLITNLVFSQKKVFYNDQGKTVSEKNATYYKIVTKTDDNIWMTQFFYISGQLKYKGCSLKKNGAKGIGRHNIYYPSGNLSESLVYDNQKLSLEEEFYESSNLKRRTIYDKEGMLESVLIYYDSSQIKDEIYYSGPEDKRKIIAKSFYKNGNLKRDDEYITTIEYKQYELVKGLCLSDEGKVIDHTPFMQMPEFPGGIDMLMNYLRINVQYPEAAKNAAKQGQVLVSFTINTQGEITDAKVERSSSYLLNNEALRVVNNMPIWSQGIIYGEIINVTYKLPINFTLEQ